MALHALLAKAGATVATGFVGAVAYDAVRSVERRLRQAGLKPNTAVIRQRVRDARATDTDE